MYIIINSICNDVNLISMDSISFSVTLIHSYSDHKVNMSTGSAKVVGTYGLTNCCCQHHVLMTPPVVSFSNTSSKVSPFKSSRGSGPEWSPVHIYIIGC